MADAGKTQGLAAQAGALALGRLFTVLSEALMMLIIVRLLGKAEVGVFGALILVYKTAVLIARAGFPATATYFVTGRSEPERRAIALRLTQLLVWLGLAAGAVLALVGFWASEQVGLDDETASLQYLIALAPLPMLELPTLILPNLLVLEGRAHAAAWSNIVRTLGGNIAMLVPVAAGASFWSVGGWMVAFGAAFFGLYLWYLYGLYGKAAVVPSPVSAGQLVRYSLPLGMTDIVSIVNGRVDRYLILGAYAASRFAEYQVGAFQVPFITNVPYDVGTVLAPRLRELFAAGKPADAVAMWRHSVTKVSLIVLPTTVAFLLGAEEFIGALFPDEYASSAQVFRCYSGLGLLRVAAFGSVIATAGAPALVLRASLAAVVSNLAISVPLLAMVGFLGPAIGTAVAFVPTVLAYCYYIAKATGLPFRAVFPWAGYLRVLALTLLAAIPAGIVKFGLSLPDAVSFVLQVVALLGTFSLLGSLTRTIESEDWRFLARWTGLARLARRRTR